MAEDNKVLRLESLSIVERRLLDLMRIHQNNLSKLSIQEAKFGIAVPLPILNEISDQQEKIEKIEKELSSLREEMDSLIRPSVVNTSSEEIINTWLNIDGIDYIVEAPYPSMGTESSILEGGIISLVNRFVGSFEIHTLSKSGGMQVSFFRHGRRVAAYIDRENKKILIPIDNAITIDHMKSNIMEMYSEEYLLSRQPKDSWIIVPPGNVLGNITFCNWAKGYKSYFMTTQVKYEQGFELWMINSPDEDLPIRAWFYENDRNIAPFIDNENLLIRFKKP